MAGYARKKTIKGKEYWYIVKGQRVKGKKNIKQIHIKYCGVDKPTTEEIKQAIEEYEQKKKSIIIPESGKKNKKHFEIQNQICKIGIAGGWKIWVPINDKNRVLSFGDINESKFLKKVPPVPEGDKWSMETYENIDVIWYDRGYPIRAFEVENETMVYSGLLRMLDMLHLMPHRINLHIVSPKSKKEKVRKEIRRPSFYYVQLFSNRHRHDKKYTPLVELCSFISFENINKLASDKDLNDRNVDDKIKIIEEKFPEPDTL